MLRRISVSLILTVGILVFSVAVLPARTHAAVAQGCDGSFLGLPTWYRYLDVGPGGTPPYAVCEINGPKVSGTNDFDWQKGIGFVAIAVVEALLRIAALIAVFFVIYGGFRFITSQGEPENSKSARETVINALIGLVISVAAAGIVSFLARTLT